MTLSELLGDNPKPLSAEEAFFLKHANQLWANRFNSIVRESKTVKKERKNGKL